MHDTARRVRVQLTEADIRALIKFARQKHKTSQNLRYQFLAWVVLLPAIPFLPMFFMHTLPTVESIVTAVILLLIGSLVFKQTLQRQRRGFEAWVHSAEARWHLQPREVEITPDYVRTTTALFEATYHWAIIAEIERFREYTYFLIGHGQIVIVPDRSFRDAADREAFVAAATQYRSLSTEGEFNCPVCSYDLRGDAAAGCPECGWGRAPESSAAR